MKNIVAVKTKLIKRFAGFIFAGLVLTLLSACKPALGSSWYSRVNDDIGMTMYITEIFVADNPVVPVLSEVPIDEADKLKKFAEAREYFVNVAPSVEEIISENIKVKAVGALSTMENVDVSIEINGDGVPLVSGKAVPVTIKIKDTQAKYGELTKVIKITQNEPFDLKLENLTIAGENAMSGSVTLPYKKNMLLAADIRAEFSYGTEKTVIPVVLEKNSIELKEDESIDVKISVKALKGQYKDFEHFVSVTRAKRAENEDVALEPLEIYVQGIKSEIGKDVSVPSNVTQITEDDIVVIFKTFDNLPVKLNPNPIKFEGNDIVNAKISVEGKEGKYLVWDMPLTVKRNADAVYNPVDKNGNKKYAIKVNTITEEIDPFTYYEKDYGFSASKFDEWVVYINDFNNSTNIASYRFKADSWSGSPEQYAGPDFGSGLKKMRDVKFYRYKSRKDRWDGNTPPIFDSEKEKRFYFYRFTASGQVSLDNSMFCVDTHSKFLFYYSDPDYISGLGVPSGWTDYAAPSKGSHKQFNEPFYLSDPVGYVKEDGSVVLYSWIKQNITNNIYTAQKNSAFTKPAEKKANGAGFSPYRNNIVKKRTEVITTENPEYTVARPLILAQPKALRVALNSTEDAVMEVKTAPAPDGETLSYKWYRNDYQSNEGGTLIPGEVLYTYRPNKTVLEDCYVYCEVTNTNSANGKTDTVKTDAVKLLISSGPLYTDAAQPKIIKQPEGKTLPINTSGNISLEVEALSMDMGQVSYQWYKNTSASNQNGTKINGETSATLNLTVDTSSVKTEYYYCVATNTNENVDGKKTADRASAVAKVEVEEAYPLAFKVNDASAGRIIALRDGKPIELNSYVKKGDKIQFLAFCNPNYETQKWDAAVPTGNINMAEITITSEDDAKNTVCDMAYIPPGKLTVTPAKLKNLTIGPTGGAAWHYHKYVYFFYDFRLAMYYDRSQPLDFQSIWSKNSGKKPTPADKLVDFTEYMRPGNKIENQASIQPKYEYFKLDMGLIYYRGYMKWGKYYLDMTQVLSDYQQSLIEFKYNRDNDTWKCDTPNNFNIPNVTISYPADFTLARGETKDFVISYTYKDSPDAELNGTAEVTYTLKWE